MAWYFNFCAPFLTNDYIINFHRFVQTACLLGFLVIYIIIHFYYKMCGPNPKKVQKQDQSDDSKEKSDKDSQNQKGSAEENSENNDDKSVSIAGGYGADQNSSYVTFKTVKKAKPKIDEQKTKPQKQINQKVTIAEIESYFPIVYGHFSIGSALSIMYSPYAQQTIATMVYILFSFFLLLANSKRKIKTTRFIWGFMCFVICFLIMSGLLEVGQANYNTLETQCFSVGYQALY